MTAAADHSTSHAATHAPAHAAHHALTEHLGPFLRKADERFGKPDDKIVVGGVLDQDVRPGVIEHDDPDVQVPSVHRGPPIDGRRRCGIDRCRIGGCGGGYRHGGKQTGHQGERTQHDGCGGSEIEKGEVAGRQCDSDGEPRRPGLCRIVRAGLGEPPGGQFSTRPPTPRDAKRPA